MRLDKYLRQCSIGTSKKVREDICNGYVEVNGQAVLKPASEIDEKTDKILWKGKEVSYKKRAYYMFNKPSGCITAKSDLSSKTVFDYFKEDDRAGIFHVGRLDKDTEGLLLFTSDGDFNNILMNPKHHANKKYFFAAIGELNQEDIEKLEIGISIGNDEPITKPSVVSDVTNSDYRSVLETIDLDKFYNRNSDTFNPKVVTGYLTITEGRKHQVKRMLKAVGCFVIYLKREAIGELKLDETLIPGTYRELTAEEINLAIQKTALY